MALNIIEALVAGSKILHMPIMSKGAARRVIEQGGVYVDGAKVSDPDAMVAIGQTVRIGKHHEFVVA